jgi:hypothetical protein
MQGQRNAGIKQLGMTDPGQTIDRNASSRIKAFEGDTTTRGKKRDGGRDRTGRHDPEHPSMLVGPTPLQTTERGVLSFRVASPPVSTAVIAPTRLPRAVPRTRRRNPSIMLRDFPKRGDAQSASSAEQSTTTVRAVLHSSLSSDLPLATHRSSHCNAGPLAPVPTCQRNHRKPQAGGSSIHTHGRGRRSRNRAARRGTVPQSRQRSGVGRRCRWLGSPSLPLNAAPPFTSVRLTPPSLFSLPSCGCRPHESRAPAAKSAPRSAPLDARSLTPASAPS